MKTALLGVATLVSTATAHVRMVGAESKVGTIPLPIRNAAVVGANGAASVKGPCGGSNTFQTAAAAAAPVPVGGKVSLGLQYAAGHQSPANLFSVTFRCGAPNNNQMRAGEDGTTTLTEAECKTIKGGTKYPVPAPTGRDVKVVECTLPTKTADELTGTGSDCTLSFQDQRKWGGCVDFKYGSNGGAVGGGGGGGGGGGQAAGGDGQAGGDNSNSGTGGTGGTGSNPAPNPVAPTTPPAAVQSISIKSIVTSGPRPALPCCGLTRHDITATPGATTSTGATTIVLSGTATGTNCNNGLNFPNNEIQATMNNVILIGNIGDLGFKNDGTDSSSSVIVGNIPAEVTLVQNVLSFAMLGDPAANPPVCDAEIMLRQIREPLSPSAGDDGGIGGVAIFLIVFSVVVVFALAGVAFRLQQQKKNTSQLPTAAAVGLPSRAKNGNESALKAGWSEAKDEAGDSYYFNQTTGETTWERDLVSV